MKEGLQSISSVSKRLQPSLLGSEFGPAMTDCRTIQKKACRNHALFWHGQDCCSLGSRHISIADNPAGVAVW